MALLNLPHEEAAYLDFNDALAQLVTPRLAEQLRGSFAGSSASTLEEVEAALQGTPEYRVEESWSRAAHRFMWWHLNHAYEMTENEVEQELDSVPAKGLGEVRLNPNLEMPGYYKNVKFHLAPRSFWGNSVYPMKDMIGEGRGIESPAFPSMARTLLTRDWIEIKEWVQKLGPDTSKVRRAVDLGCGIGRATLALKELYPNAEIYGVDMSGPMLRYAHYRAEKAGLPITFVQASVEDMPFEPGFFDLMVSYVMTHEIPPRYLKDYAREAHRVLAPGGVLLNGDVKPYDQQAPLMRFMLDRQVASGSEPYWRSSLTSDLAETFREFGFAEVSEVDGSKGRHFPWWTIAAG